MNVRWWCLFSLATVSTLALASSCRLEGERKSTSSVPPQAISYKMRTLNSGKHIKVISFGPVESKPSRMMLDYLTDLDVYDSASLEKEVEEIWADIRKDLASDVNRVEIIPTEPAERRKNSHIQALSKAYVYDRCGEEWCKGSGFQRRE